MYGQDVSIAADIDTSTEPGDVAIPKLGVHKPSGKWKHLHLFPQLFYPSHHYGAAERW
ncbi:hypothetical protein ARSEF4850_004374 [Beauveria asiatica]